MSDLGEEMGWGGLLVPELAEVTSFTKIALISSVIWAAWHLPGIFLADLSGSTLRCYAAVMFTVVLIAINFPFAWLTLRSGSLWPAVGCMPATTCLFIRSSSSLPVIPSSPLTSLESLVSALP